MSAAQHGHGLHFMTWWQEVNDLLAARAADQMLYGDARYWFGRSYSPETAAELHIEEIEYRTGRENVG